MKPDLFDIFGLAVGLFFVISAVPLVVRRKRVVQRTLLRQRSLFGPSFADWMAKRTDSKGNVLILVGAGWFVLGAAISYYSLLGLGIRV